MTPRVTPAMANEPDPDENIFVAALQWDDPAERAAYLDEACAGQPDLRARVEALLRASHEAQTFLERPVGVPRPAPDAPSPTLKLGFSDLVPDPEGPGTRIGRYKILQQIGEGGCGTVFMAEQEEPVRRRVALKVIKLGMDTKQVVARFEAERQALALMDHPNIAKVLDAGATDSGRPFFVMELVRGIPITRYCDENKLDTLQRLDLFIKVCQAIQHAHQKGIIHRDIKPSNILVTLHDGVPVPKVIDFGIAKATEGRLTNATLFTAFEQFIGTPAYMSPEQAEMSGLDIDTRSDIYSLGVLLYELLTGQTPFDARELAQSGLDAMRKTIREKEPQRPSTRLSTLQGDALAATATAHGSDSAHFLRRIRGDLDWIVMKCLEKDRVRRYETANGLAADLRRHLNDEPVTARPPSTSYRIQKAWRRNKLIFAIGFASAIGLLAIFSALTFALIRERALNSESARADSIATFVVEMLNDSIPKLIVKNDTEAVRVLLDSADQLASETLNKSPAAELLLCDTLAQYVLRLNPAGGRKLADRIEALLPKVPDDRLPPQRSRDIIRVDIACAQIAVGDVEHGRAVLDNLIREFRHRGPKADIARANALGSLGQILLCMDRPAEAEPLLEEAHRVDMAWSDAYAYALLLNGRHALAERTADGCIRWYRDESARDPNWSRLFEVADQLGALPGYWTLIQAQCFQGRSSEAEALVEERLGGRHGESMSHAQRRHLESMRTSIRMQSGKRDVFEPSWIASAMEPDATVDALVVGMAAASAGGDTEAIEQLARIAHMRAHNDTSAPTASLLFQALMLRPRDEDARSILPLLLTRIEQAPDRDGSEDLLPLMKAQLAFCLGHHDKALQWLEHWSHSRSQLPINALRLRQLQSFPVAEFWKAMILAQLQRPQEAATAYVQGLQKISATFTPWPSPAVAGLSHALHHKAREHLHSRGIATAEPGNTP